MLLSFSQPGCNLDFTLLNNQGRKAGAPCPDQVAYLQGYLLL
jgi:hypothetical protein